MRKSYLVVLSLLTALGFIESRAQACPPSSLDNRIITFTIKTATGTLPKTGAYRIVFTNFTGSTTAGSNVLTRISGKTVNATNGFSDYQVNGLETSYAYAATSGNGTNVLNYNAPLGGNFTNTFGNSVQTGTFALTDERLDLDGDLVSEVLFQTVTNALTNIPPNFVAAWPLVFSNNFRGVTVTQAYVFPTNSVTIQTFSPTNFYKIIAQFDFNDDGTKDLIWQDSTNKAILISFLNGTNVIGETNLAYTNLNASLVGLLNSTNFATDCHPDFLFRAKDTSLFVVNYENMMTNTSSILSDYTTNKVNAGKKVSSLWDVAFVADLNGDGWQDIVWQNKTGPVGVWFMKGTTLIKNVVVNNPFAVSGAWRLAGNADFNRDGQLDFVWRNKFTGQIAVSFMSGIKYVSSVRTIGPTSDILTVGPR